MIALSGLVDGKGNLVARARLVTVSDFDPLFPPEWLGDGLPSRRFKFLTNGVDRTITLDLAAFLGDFETWAGGVPEGWSIFVDGTGTVAQTVVAGEVHSGASAVKLNHGSGTALALREIVVRSGEWWNFAAFCRIAAAGSAALAVLNLRTNHYLKSDMTWDTTGAFQIAASEAASAVYVEKAGTFRVETYADCQSPLTTLRIFVADTGAGGASDFSFWDDVYFWPSHNLLSVIGHNVGPLVVPQYRSSTDNFGASDVLEATLTPHQNQFFTYLAAASTKRFARLKLVGINDATPWLGELVIGYGERLATGTSWGFRVRRVDPRLQSVGGEYASLFRQAEAVGARGLRFEIRNEANYMAHVSELWRRQRGDSLLIVPVEADPRVFLGRLPPELEDERAFIARWDNGLDLDPFPLPSIVG